LKRPGVWGSPLDYVRAYAGTTQHFYRYFADTALERARKGERWAALRAVGIAFRHFPMRSTRHLLTDTTLRRAILMLLSSTRAAAAQMHHLPIWLYLAHC